MKKSILIFLVFMLLLSNWKSQESSDSLLILPKVANLKNRLGFAASMFSGYGLSYGYSFNDKYLLEITSSIYGIGGGKSKNEENQKDLTSTLGLEFQRNVYLSSNSRFYFLAALSYWYDSHKTSNSDDSETNFITGLSLGWEIILDQRLILNLEGGYRYSKNSFSGNVPYTAKDYNLGFGIGGGFYYAF